MALAQATRADLVVIEKSLRKLNLFKKHELLRSYDIALGREPIGKKQFEGDGKTPEGRYKISFKRVNSSFYKALQISYPNAQDAAFARKMGGRPGGAIMIHGLRDGFEAVPKMLQGLHDYLDWTDGCVAVTNSEMDEIFDLVPINTRVWIFP